jgi:hypothetical protein
VPAAAALPSAAAAAAAASALAFLPWNGCGSMGSPYDTGMELSCCLCGLAWRAAQRGPLAHGYAARAPLPPGASRVPARSGRALRPSHAAKRPSPLPCRLCIPGVRGTAGRDCQEVYQPAAAAEQRALARLRGAAAPPAGAAAPPPAAPAAAEPTAGGGGGDDAPTPSQKEAAGDLVRSILLEEQRARTKEIVDSAWQSLE